jgi:hypothetical protein
MIAYRMIMEDEFIEDSFTFSCIVFFSEKVVNEDAALEKF